MTVVGVLTRRSTSIASSPTREVSVGVWQKVSCCLVWVWEVPRCCCDDKQSVRSSPIIANKQASMSRNDYSWMAKIRWGVSEEDDLGGNNPSGNRCNQAPQSILHFEKARSKADMAMVEGANRRLSADDCFQNWLINVSVNFMITMDVIPIGKGSNHNENIWRTNMDGAICGTMSKRKIWSKWHSNCTNCASSKGKLEASRQWRKKEKGRRSNRKAITIDWQELVVLVTW